MPLPDHIVRKLGREAGLHNIIHITAPWVTECFIPSNFVYRLLATMVRMTKSQAIAGGLLVYCGTLSAAYAYSKREQVRVCQARTPLSRPSCASPLSRIVSLALPFG